MEQPRPRRGWAADPVDRRRTTANVVLGAVAGLHPRELARTPALALAWVATVVATALTGLAPTTYPVVLSTGLWVILILGSLGASCAWERVRADAASLRVHGPAGRASAGEQDPASAVGHWRSSPRAAALAVGVTDACHTAVLAVTAAVPPLRGQQDPAPVLGVAAVTVIAASTLGAWRPVLLAAAVDRLVRHNVLPTSRRAVTDAGRVSTVVLGTTGTATSSEPAVADVFPAAETSRAELLRTVLRCCAGDRTPVGQCLARYARDQLAKQGSDRRCTSTFELGRSGVVPIPMADCGEGWAARLPDGTVLRTGPHHLLDRWAELPDGPSGVELDRVTGRIAGRGAAPVLVARQDPHERAQVLGVVHVEEPVRPGAADLRHRLTELGVRTVLATADQPDRARTVASDLGINEVVADVSPEGRLRIVRDAQARGRLVAVVGAGAGDAPALAAADVGVAMHTGAPEARQAASVLDLACEPDTVVDLVRFGRDLVATRQALSAFAAASVTAYLLLLGPVVSGDLLPRVGVLAALHLSDPPLAVLAAVLLGAALTVVQAVLAFRGVRSEPGDRIGARWRTRLLFAGSGLALVLGSLTFIDGALTRLTGGSL